MLAHHDGLHGRVLLHDGLHREAEFETGAHPRHVGHLAAEDFLRELFAVLRRCDRDDRIGMHVVDELCRDEAVQRRVDRGSARVQVERRVGLHADHVVFGGRLQALVGARGVELLHIEQLLLVERGEVFARAGAQVAAGTLDPKHLGRLTGERVFLDDLRGGVAAAGVGDALVAAEDVGAIDEATDRIEGGGLGVVPGEVNEFVGFHGV